ncbi:ATP-binding protein [Actinocorallia longicatena]|uniref:Histidine kinase/HSP90-like ATPase domain-containing protein n=1 Tax=Actinocorallia longicatena TaxID=111803 RepID=A0ABP6QP65_9ACTN
MDEYRDARTDDAAEIRLTLLAEPSSVILAREMVRYALTQWGYPKDTVHDSMLVMSEMATNAVNAAQGAEIQLRCTVYGHAPLLECWDPSPVFPAQPPAPEDAESGRGLTIIAAYAKDSGLRPSGTGRGKTIWALMPA